jgi:undecaprenyl pyrophosphate phosphatase UppP
MDETMTNPEYPSRNPLNNPTHRQQKWVRLLGVVFRLLIILGLLLFVVMVFGLIFTSAVSDWMFLLPIALIFLGIVVAWFEYRLHRQATAGDSQETNQED